MSSASQALTTRRALFAAAAALPAVVALPAMAGPHADADLLALYDRWVTAHAAYHEAEDRAEEVWITVYRSTPIPDALQSNYGAQARGLPDFAAGLPVPNRVSKQYEVSHRDQVARALGWSKSAFQQSGINRRSMERCQEVLDALDRLKADREANMAAAGYRALADRTAELARVLDDIEQQLVKAKATTMEGLRVKAAFARRYNDRPDGDDVSLSSDALWSLLDDLQMRSA